MSSLLGINLTLTDGLKVTFAGGGGGGGVREPQVADDIPSSLPAASVSLVSTVLMLDSFESLERRGCDRAPTGELGAVFDVDAAAGRGGGGHQRQRFGQEVKTSARG